ncbi:MAG: hypothetical protein HY248_02980, partial [Fimbriimonas ginsengisoli]|nr:hypothetical protein [Fimbriimonas ginsengisoli]
MPQELLEAIRDLARNLVALGPPASTTPSAALRKLAVTVVMGAQTNWGEDGGPSVLVDPRGAHLRASRRRTVVHLRPDRADALAGCYNRYGLFMRIAFFGSSLVSAYWNGAATYFRGIIKPLHAMGHEITFYEPDAYDRQKHRDIEDPPWAKVVVYPADGSEGLYRAVEDAESADMIVKASGVGVFDEFLDQAVVEIKRPNSLIAFWDVDAPATLDRVAQDPSDPFGDLIPRYDMILTYGGGDPVVQAYKRLGAQRCIPVYNALDPSTHFPVAPDERFAADLGFLGNRLPDRE